MTKTLTAAVDAAMVEMANIHPPLRRSECERLIRAALAAEGEAQPTGWTITFEDGRDFCRHASILIGAAYTSPEDAMKRFQNGTLFGGATWGKVHGAAPQPAEREQAAQQPSQPQGEHPPLPEPKVNITAGDWTCVADVSYFTAAQMHAYVEADRAQRHAAELTDEPKDAARYRWLRRCRGQEHDPLFTVHHELDGTLWGGDLDAAIDEAIAADRAARGGE